MSHYRARHIQEGHRQNVPVGDALGKPRTNASVLPLPLT